MPNIFDEPKELKKWAMKLANSCGGQQVSTGAILTKLDMNKVISLVEVFVNDHNEYTTAVEQAEKEEE